MKNFMVAAILVLATISSVNAQYGNDYNNNSYGNAYDDDRYYYDDEFDWHWDVRVRISNGIQNGQITQNESRRLYRQLENLEQKEYAYQADGVYSNWEQQEVWDDISGLNRRLGLELYDFDRTFYGFNNWGYDYRGYNRWFYQGGYDFYRFDRRGFGSIRLGYVCRPNYVGWYSNNNNRVGRDYHNERSRNYDNRSNNARGNDRRTYDDNNRNSQRNTNEAGRNSRGSSDNNRNSQGNTNGGSRGNSDSRNTQPSTGNYGRNSQENGNSGTETRRNRPDVDVTPSNPSGNYGSGSGVDNSRSERNTPSPRTQESEGRRSRNESSPSVERPSRNERSSSPRVERPSRSVESAPSQPSAGGQSRGGRTENAPSGNNGGGRSEGKSRRN